MPGQPRSTRKSPSIEWHPFPQMWLLFSDARSRLNLSNEPTSRIWRSSPPTSLKADSLQKMVNESIRFEMVWFTSSLPKRSNDPKSSYPSNRASD